MRRHWLLPFSPPHLSSHSLLSELTFPRRPAVSSTLQASPWWVIICSFSTLRAHTGFYQISGAPRDRSANLGECELIAGHWEGVDDTTTIYGHLCLTGFPPVP